MDNPTRVFCDTVEYGRQAENEFILGPPTSVPDPLARIEALESRLRVNRLWQKKSSHGYRR